MPRKRSNIGRQTRRTRNEAIRRANETDEQRSQRMERSRSSLRGNQIEGNFTESNTLNNEHRRRTHNTFQLNRAAFTYNPRVDYAAHKSVSIGKMDKICHYCRAYKYENETPGMCCLSGKVKLLPLNTPPEPLLSLLSGNTPQSRHFLTNIQSYNSCFQMTSFGATNIIRDTFMPTFKVISSHGLSNCVSLSDLSNAHTLNDYARFSTFYVTDTRASIPSCRIIVAIT